MMKDYKQVKINVKLILIVLDVGRNSFKGIANVAQTKN